MNLDDTLAEWAATVRLPDAEATDIYRRIVTTPVAGQQLSAGLDPSWWQEFTAEFTARMVASTRPSWAT